MPILSILPKDKGSVIADIMAQCLAPTYSQGLLTAQVLNVFPVVSLFLGTMCLVYLSLVTHPSTVMLLVGLWVRIGASRTHMKRIDFNLSFLIVGQSVTCVLFKSPCFIVTLPGCKRSNVRRLCAELI